jgi:glucose/arabinose dehydrogenase
LIVVAAIAAAGYAFRGRLFTLLFPGEPPPAPQRGLAAADLPDGALTVLARDLEVPWALAFTPDGGLLVTERPGRLVHIDIDGGRRRSYPVPGVRAIGEGGLMGLALHPDFASNGWLYVCLTAEGDGGLENRVERYRFDADRGLSDRTVILDGIPAAVFHDGCRLAFGPDSDLYITTGDATVPERAQDLSSLAGKILRLADDGTIPPDNPFATPVYSYGHRNPQGLAWDDAGRLWSTEHGRSGLRSGLDELNLIEPGANYGWPVIQGDETAPDKVAPVLHSGPDYTWAPAGLAFADGRLFFGGLRGEALYEVRPPLERGRARLRAHFHSELGRIRAVRVGPDGMLYFTTSNRDGRGRVRRGDDKIVRVDPAVFR